MSKVNVTYFGSKTSGFSGTTATMETLEPLLSEFVQIKTYSHVSNKFIRIAHMTYGYFRHGLNSKAIIIDVYSTSAFYYAEWMSTLARLMGNKIILLVLHGGGLPSLYKKNSTRVRKLFNRANHIIAPSYYLKDYFEKNGFTLNLIPNSIELQDYPFLKRTSVRPKLLALRGFKKTYNPLMTLQATAILVAQGVEVELLMLGNEDEDCYPEVLDFVSSNGLENYVKIKPKQPKKVWIELSKEYDIMVSNPVVDNTPVSIIEGMALGMCVITTAVGGVPFIFEDEKNSLFVSNDNAKEMAKKISQLIENNALALDLSRNGRLFAEQYDWGQIQHLWKNVLMSKDNKYV